MRALTGRTEFSPFLVKTDKYKTMFKSEPLEHQWDDASTWYWMDNSAFKSHFLNALSITLPGCERFFIDAVKPHLALVSDDLKPFVREFVKQESHHQAVHRDYNLWLQGCGLPVEGAIRSCDRGWSLARRLSPKWRLALTVCIEHITVICTSVLLQNPELLEAMDPHFRRVWQWHAREEIEHKAVTMDVWNECYRDTWSLRLAMLITLPVYMWYVGKHTLVFLAAEHRLWRSMNVSDGFDFLFGRQGIISGSWSQWLDIFRKDFHPDMHDHISLLSVPKFVNLRDK